MKLTQLRRTTFAIALFGLLISPTIAAQKGTAQDLQTSQQDTKQQSPPAEKLPIGEPLMAFVDALRPSVVTVIVTDANGMEITDATGFVIDDSLILTSHSAIAKGAAARVQFRSGEMLPLKSVVAKHIDADLVMVAIERPEHLESTPAETLPLAETVAQPGTEVIMITSPIGRDQIVRQGRVGSAIEIENVDAAIGFNIIGADDANGSPVIDATGQAVGVMTSRGSGDEQELFILPSTEILTMRKGAAGASPMAIADYHQEYGESVGADLAAEEAAAEVNLEAKIEKQEDGSLLIDDQYVVKGSGTREDPYRITWSLLLSASKVYQPRKGKTNLPERITFLHDKWIQMDGFIAVPLMSEETDELLFMLNQWDGCCIGVPPSPYDAVEVTLVAPMKMQSGVNIFNYGKMTGLLKVDPYVVNNWLVGLYLMEDAQLVLE